MEITMYDNLLLLPLFQGLSKNDFTSIIEKVKFNFLTYQEGENVLLQGSNCQHLCFLLSGEIVAKTTDKDYGYTLSEVLEGPYIIEPQSLFGMFPVYTATYQAHSQVKILKIDKSFIFSELNNHEIFRLNYLNFLSNRSQVAYQKLWQSHIGTLNEKFHRFFFLRCQKQEGKKMLSITMEELSRLINETRINVSRLLNELQSKELIQLKRKEIVIPDFEKLTEYLVQPI